MSFIVDRTDIEARFRDVRALLSFIKSLESTELPPRDTDEVKILRGLYYVHLYAAFEKSVNDVFQAYLAKVSQLEIPASHTASSFWPAALDPKFKSLQSTNGAGNWKSRANFIEAINSTDHCVLNTGLFSDHLQNVWPETIHTLIAYLGLAAPTWDSNEDLAVDEIVHKRNQVAHGRSSALSVGSSGRSEELERRFDSTYRLLDLFITSLESGFVSLDYVKSEFRSIYQVKIAAE